MNSTLRIFLTTIGADEQGIAIAVYLFTLIYALIVLFFEFWIDGADAVLRRVPIQNGAAVELHDLQSPEEIPSETSSTDSLMSDKEESGSSALQVRRRQEISPSCDTSTTVKTAT